jgi:hypothetical protein
VTHTNTTGTTRGWFDGVGYAPGVGLMGMVGTTTTNVNLSSYSATRTAQRLSPPSQPTHLGMLIYFFAGMALICLEMKVGVAAVANHSSFLAAVCRVVVAVIVLTIAVLFSRSEKRRYAMEYPWWERMMALWWVAYYCAVCDHVSIPARTVQGLAVGWSWHANNMRAGLLTAASKVDEYTRSLNRGRP